MLGIAFRTLRTRAGSFGGVFAMLVVTAAIVCAAAQLMATALGAPGAGRYAAADAVVRADPEVAIGFGDNVEHVDVRRAVLLPDAAVARAASTPGVARAVGDVTFPLAVAVPGERSREPGASSGRPLPGVAGEPAHGHGWSSAALTPYRLATGSAPAGPGDVVLDAPTARAGGVRVGDRVRVVAPGGDETLRVSGIARASAGQEARQAAIFFADAHARALSGLGDGVNAIAVVARPGQDPAALRERLGEAIAAPAPADAAPADAAPAVPARVEVLDRRHASAADAGDPRAGDRVELIAIVASGGGITIALAVFVVAGTLGYVVARRRRELALLRAVGATPRQVRRLLLGETAAVGLLAGLAGCVLATALFDPFARALEGAGVAPEGFAVTPHWLPYAIAVAVGLVVALLASLVAVRRALKVAPGEALLEAAVPPRRMHWLRVGLGLVALAGGCVLVGVLSFAALDFATLAALTFAIGVALLGPLLLGWPAALLGRLLRAGGGAGYLAAGALATGRFRTGAVGAAIVLVVAMTGAQTLALATGQAATERVTEQRVQADRVLVATAGGGLPPALAESAAALPGVRAAAGMVATEVYLLDRDLTHDGDSWEAAGLDPARLDGALDLGVRTGDLDAVRGEAIAISETVADDGGVGLGDELTAQLADGARTRLRVVAIYDRANGLGDVVLPRDLALAHADAALDEAIFVATEPRAPAAGSATDARADDSASPAGPDDAASLAALADANPTVSLQTRGQYLDGVESSGQEAARAQWVVSALMIALAAMAALNTGAMAAAERRRELLLARLGGATRRQVRRALLLEAGVATGVGVAAGVLVAFVSTMGAASDPRGGPLALPLGQLAVVVLGGAALGLVALLGPAALLNRADPVALSGARA